MHMGTPSGKYLLGLLLSSNSHRAYCDTHRGDLPYLIYCSFPGEGVLANCWRMVWKGSLD